MENVVARLLTNTMQQKPHVCNEEISLAAGWLLEQFEVLLFTFKNETMVLKPIKDLVIISKTINKY